MRNMGSVARGFTATAKRHCKKTRPVKVIASSTEQAGHTFSQLDLADHFS